MELVIVRTWEGVPVRSDEEVRLTLSGDSAALIVDISAVYHGDPAPTGPPGATDRLWEHEVAELFLVGEGERYTEIELGPHGHHLVLRLHGIRHPVETLLPLDYTARIEGGRWTGRARIPRSYLPDPVRSMNAYAIWGPPERRRYLAWSPVPGPAADFHRLSLFPPLPRPLP